MTNECVRCTRPMPDQAYACSSCAYRAGDQLHELADMVGAARDIAHGFAHRGTGGSSGKPGSRLPLDLGATSKLDAVQGELVGWLRHVMTVRGIPDGLDNPAGDLVILAANFLAGHIEWMRHRQEADEFLAAVDACTRVVRGLARGPAEQKYLGPCGAVLGPNSCPAGTERMCLSMLEGFARCDEGECVHWESQVCEGDVYASRGSRTGRCRVCEAEASTNERAAWLDAEVRSHAFRAARIAEAYRVNVNTIRSWAARGQLVPHGHDGEDRPLYNVGDVLDLAAADAARRATEQAKRARRAAAKAAESEDAA